QKIVGDGFASMLQLGRQKAGVSFILASQTYAQLKNSEGKDFAHEIDTDTNFKCFFTVDDDDAQKLSRQSGEELVLLPTTGVSHGASETHKIVNPCQVGHVAETASLTRQFGTTISASIRPRLTANDFAEMNSDIRKFIFF